MYLHECREDDGLFPEMNVDEAISIGILVVNDDLACQNKVAEVLRRCNYEVLHTGTVYDALHAIWENKERLDLVITNSQKLESEGLAIIQNIKQRLKLNVLLIRSDERIEPKGELPSFSAYVLDGVSVNSFNNLLENAKRVEEDKKGAAANQQENVERASVSNTAVETNKASSSIKDATCLNQKREAVELYGERSEDSNDDHRKGKKPRVTWTNEMHQKFLDAIERLGYDKAVPKKIVEVMGVPGLTRENVASHLQKYRCSMRRTQETIFGSLACRSTRNELQGLSFVTSPSSLQTNMPSFPTVKESKQQQCLSTSKDLAFASISEGKFYTRIGGDLISGVDKLRNMMQRRDKHSLSSDNSNHSDATKFVGYRIIGNQIDYGPINRINTDAVMYTPKRLEDQPTSYVQNHPISDQKIGVGSGGCILQQYSLLGSSSSRIHGTETAGITINTSEEPDLLSSFSSKIENLARGPPTLSSVQYWDTSADAASFHNPSENASTTLSALTPTDCDLLLPPLEAPGNDFLEQTTAAFVDDISQQRHYSPPPPPPPPLPQTFQNLDEIFEQGGNDESLLNGINTYDQFDIQEFDDTYFS